MKKVVIPFVILISSLLIIFRFSRYQFISGNLEMDMIVVVVCVVFFVLGVYINRRYFKQGKTQPGRNIDHDKIKELELRDREMEILKLIAQGCSNQEIGEQLFLSESTIKTHVSKILLKLNARRRTEAVSIARKWHLI